MSHSKPYLVTRAIVRGSVYTLTVGAFIGWSFFGIWVLWALVTKP